MSKDYTNNIIKILHRLLEGGFTQKQAEAQIEVLTEYTDNHLATKSDISDVKREILDVRKDMREMELRLTIRISSIVGLMMGFFYSLDKFF